MKEAAEILDVSQNTLRKLADDGRIDTIRLSGQRRYNITGNGLIVMKSLPGTVCSAPW
jgi:excisionase family DNA binding protein